MIQTKIKRRRPSRGGAKPFGAAALSVAFGLMLLIWPQAALAGARSGLTLCGEIVIPSLFPFLCLTTFVIESGLAQKAGRLFGPLMRFVFRLPGSAAAALFLGAVCGYPAGAAAVAGLKRQGLLEKDDSERLLSFCINSGPAFIIGAVGAGLLKNTFSGFLLYAAHLGASLLIGVGAAVFARRPAKNRRSAAGGSSKKAVKPKKAAEAFVSSVSGSAKSMLVISAFVVFFAAVTGLLSGTGALPAVSFLFARLFPAGLNAAAIEHLLPGFFEVSNGCAAAAGLNGLLSLCLISAALSWSGLSVQCQVVAIVGGDGLSTRKYLLARLPHMALSIALTLLLFHLFPQSVPAFANQAPILSASIHAAPGSVALLLLTAMLLLSQLKV